MRKYYRKLALACLLVLTLTAWARSAPRLGEPPRMPEDDYRDARLLDGYGVQAASGSNLASGDASLSKLSREETGALLSQSPLTLPATLYDSAPSVKAPYAPGRLADEALQAALRRLNALRRIAGLKAVALDAGLCESAQYGAVLLAASDFGHTPRRPADMDAAFYEKAVEATASSNIAWGYSLTAAVDGFMDDSDGGNVDRLGHRRWQLNPAMGKVGFGQAFRDGDPMTAEKVFDQSADEADYDFVAWPASGYFPSGLFGVNQAWSVSLNRNRYAVPAQSDLTVTLRRVGDGKTWTFSGARSYAAADSGPYFHVDTDGYGIPNCIIFRPDGVRDYDGEYIVTITGLRDRSGAAVGEFSYQTTFFDASAYADAVVSAVEASPWSVLRLPAARADAATLAKFSALLPRTAAVTTEDGRTLYADITGGWTLDRTRQRWTASVAADGLSDPKGLLPEIAVSYTVESDTGLLSVIGAPAQFRLWRCLSDLDAVELYQSAPSGLVKRYDDHSENYWVDAHGYCIFHVGEWTAADAGDWYALYYSGNPLLKEAFLAANEPTPNASLSGGSVSGGTVYVNVNGTPGDGARLYFAAFDGNGKFLSAVVREASASGAYSAGLNLSGAARVSAFLTTPESVPLCEPYPITLSN